MQQELARQQRYYRRLGNELFGAAWGTGSIYFAWTNAVTMRATPTIANVNANIVLRRPANSTAPSVTYGSTVGSIPTKDGGWIVWSMTAGALTAGEPLGTDTADIFAVEADL